MRAEYILPMGVGGHGRADAQIGTVAGSQSDNRPPAKEHIFIEYLGPYRTGLIK